MDCSPGENGKGLITLYRQTNLVMGDLTVFSFFMYPVISKNYIFTANGKSGLPFQNPTF